MRETVLRALFDRFRLRIGASGCPENDDRDRDRPLAPLDLSRRGFFKALAIGAAGLALTAELDVERLLWVPGAKTIFLPCDDDWMTREALRILTRNLQFTTSISRHYNDLFVRDSSARLNVAWPRRWAIHA